MNNNKIIEDLVSDLSKNPLDPEKNFAIAIEYEKLNQTASAVSFYLRAIEYGYRDFPEIAYASLLKIAICFDSQKDRSFTVSNAIMQAISLLPFRPEAYFLMSKFYEKSGQWQECYTFSVLGLQYIREPELPVYVLYEGANSLKFQKAISAWWVGRKDESIELLTFLYKNRKSLSEVYVSAVEQNCERLGIDDVNF